MVTPGDSSIGRFTNTTVNAIPFESHATIQSLDLWVALRIAAEINVELEDISIASAGLYINTPTIHASVSSVDNVDINCNPINPSTANAEQLQDVLTDVIRVDVSASIDFGVYADVSY